jgi:hypothetical protein
MSEGAARVQPERSQLLRQLRSLLPRLADPLEIVAEQILGLDSRIDFVAKDRRGQVVLVFLADRGSDLRALADCLAQCSWVEPRVGDWLKLAPQLGLRPELGVRVLLLASQLDPRTIAAARSVEGPSSIWDSAAPSRTGPASRSGSICWTPRRRLRSRSRGPPPRDFEPASTRRTSEAEPLPTGRARLTRFVTG